MLRLFYFRSVVQIRVEIQLDGGSQVGVAHALAAHACAPRLNNNALIFL